VQELTALGVRFVLFHADPMSHGPGIATNSRATPDALNPDAPTFVSLFAKRPNPA
jgi:hypothetical protein